MRLFADENLPAGILHWLRATGHDVISASELHCGEVDERWLHLANADQRLIVTADKDFGELINREGLSSYGVIL
jgi:predicted nuclease of predicted toxin-antitoxin system